MTLPDLYVRSTRHIHLRLRKTLILLIVLGMLGVNLQPLQAAAPGDPDAPDPHPARENAAAVTLFTAGVQLAPLLPGLLGFDEPHTYLLLVQNNHELRATGGFITAVGRITFDRGRITELKIEDSYAIARDDVDHPLAPEPVKRFMGIEILFLRDANWSPDFPTTAQFARSLYTQDAGVQVDGVVSIDLRAVELLVGALAPLEIPGAEEPLTGDNVMQQLVSFWDQPLGSETPEAEEGSLLEREDWVLQRKDFIPLVAQSAMARIQSGNFNALSLIDAVDAALRERAVQVWLADPTAAALIAKQGWDGRLHPEAGADYIALVDTNMGYNKANAVLENDVAYSVAWPHGPTAPAQATLAVTYRHPLQVVDERCLPLPDFGTIASYSGQIERCYFDYVRLYVPGGSKLVALEGVEADTISSRLGERGTQVFAGYFSLKPGEEHTVTFAYTLPPAITPENYQLVVQRQAGAAPLPLEVTVGEKALHTTLVDGRLLWQPAAGSVAVQ
ncbi:MAG: DUF4012 domain-containing protein [Caldilineaceae bacterium]|nr:DUF4012 domain-containing protein [Caldilineaceae bacterium]